MFLLDTNVISELRKVHQRRTDPNFLAWSKNLHWADLYLSSITVYELEVGVSQLELYDVVQAEILRAWLRDKVLVRFSSRTISVTAEIAARAAKLQTSRTRQLEDTLIAATAYVHRMKLVTRHVGDFKDTGVDVINPWEPTTIV